MIHRGRVHGKRCNNCMGAVKAKWIGNILLKLRITSSRYENWPVKIFKWKNIFVNETHNLWPWKGKNKILRVSCNSIKKFLSLNWCVFMDLPVHV